MTCAVRVNQRQGAGAMLPLPLPEVRALLGVMRAAVPADAAPAAVLRQVELQVVRDGVIAAANRRYMGSAGPTNVLSFPGGEDMAGMLVLSADTVQREALLYGQEPAEHCVRLLAHGMGHLLGYDHGPEMDALCGIMETAALRVVYGG